MKLASSGRQPENTVLANYALSTGRFSNKNTGTYAPGYF